MEKQQRGRFANHAVPIPRRLFEGERDEKLGEYENAKRCHRVSKHKGFYVNHAPDGANKSPKAKAMSVKQTCKAATLPTLANRRLAKNKKDNKSGFFSG